MENILALRRKHQTAMIFTPSCTRIAIAIVSSPADASVRHPIRVIHTLSVGVTVVHYFARNWEMKRRVNGSYTSFKTHSMLRKVNYVIVNDEVLEEMPHKGI